LYHYNMNILVFFISATSLTTCSAYVAFAADAEPVCKTVQGQPCIFPFRYRGKTYHQCTHDYTTNGKPWCAYKVRSNGDAFPDKWEDCDTTACGPSNIITPSTKKPVSSDCKCGQKKKDRSFVYPLIWNGAETLVNEYPWHVGLAHSSFRQKVGCGGTIISAQTILSAAHCTYRSSKDYYVVLVGGHNVLDTSSSQYKKICKIYNHPNYNPSNIDMDLSIIELCEPLTFSDKVQPVCLPDHQHDGTEFENLKHTVTGWGRTSYEGPSSDVLLETDVTTMSNDACCSYPFNWKCSFITRNMMCAIRPSTDACRGDSGGPLVTYSSSKKSHVLTGVVSWGHRECAKAEYPGVYARVSMVIDWIKGKMNGATCYKQR